MGVARRTEKRGVRARSKSTPLAKWIKRILATFTIVGLVSVIFGFVYMFNRIKAAEPLVADIEEKLKTYNSKPSRIFSADGKLLYEIKPIFRDSISLTQLPKHVINAVLAAEDKRFYSHSGVDGWGLARASVSFVHAGEVSGGGSTISMQLAKKLFSASEKTMNRKVQDIAIAFQLEKKYTKDQILEMYLNQIYFGEQAYGINAAASIYFNKEVEDLDLAEAATLARCIRLPSSQNPVKDFQRAMTNKNVVLGIMLEEHMITQDEFEKAKAEQPKVRGLAQQRFSRYYGARYHVAAVKRELERRGITIAEGGYTITTTLDTEVQRAAEEAVEDTVRGYRGLDVNAGAFICIDNEGRVLADVGGRNFAKNQYSRTTQSRMQPGSAFKTFVYAEALKEGIIDEYSEISNEMVKVPKGRGEYWIPRNHGRYGGTVSLFSAFVNSVNVPAVRTFMQIGSKRASELITKDFGFTSKIDPYPAVALGSSDVKPIEMAEAYSVLMLDGRRVKPSIIKEIIDPTGEVVYQAKSEYYATRIGPAVCNVMERLMRGVVTDGTGKKAGSCPDAHGKTGTTNGGKSVWFCGYAKGIVGIAWAGNEYYDKKRDRWLLREMPESYGGDIAAPMWSKAMRAAIAKYGSDVKPDFRVRQEIPRERTVEEEEEAERLREEKRLAEEAKKNQTPDDLRGDEEGPVAPATNAEGTTTPPVGPTIPTTDPPKTDPEPPKRNDPPKRDPPRNDEDSGYVEVEVCADSGLLATRYCPETINRKYSKSRKPKRACGVHKSPQEGGDG